jgi:hypothetical protein
MISTFIQLVLGGARRRPATLVRTGRVSLALAMLATMLAPAAVPTALAADPFTAESRLQVVLKEVKIHDDHDWGEGEMELHVSIGRCPVDLPAPCLFNTVPAGPQAHAKLTFNADTNEVVPLKDRIVPQEGDETEPLAPPEWGFSTRAGYYNVVRFDMTENDSVTNSEGMGWVAHVLEAGKHGQHLGVFSERSFTHQGAKVGDYTITYEIRKAPLPDIRPLSLRVEDLPNGDQRVCMTVLNQEYFDAGEFMVDLTVDGRGIPGGRGRVASLAALKQVEACTAKVLLPISGPHTLAAVVDSSGTLKEISEVNNSYEQPYTGKGPAASLTKPDLTVSEIRINGQVPDGKDDCKDGKNDVAVLVKNAGTADAETFTVRLVVDDAQGTGPEQSVSGLAAGQEREVRFDDVRLKKGERSLTATADAANTVAEAKEDNGELKVTARCKGQE